MAVTAEEITSRFSEFCSVDKDKIVAAIAQAEGCINRDQWGENRANEAVLYLASHFLVTNPRGSGDEPGARTAEGEGQLSASYSVAAWMQGPFASTAYGRMYLELRRTAFPERFTVT